MAKDKSDQGKPTCCGPGDLSACVIEPAKKKKKTDSNAKPSKESSEKTQPEAESE